MPRYPQNIKEQVRSLRLAGFSLNQIRETTKVPKTTIHDWVYDISLSSEQKAALKEKGLVLLQEGRIKTQAAFKERRDVLQKVLKQEGRAETGPLSSREKFIAGVALYWAEGFKNTSERRLGFCNSDPNMIRFYLNWLENSLGITKERFVARVTLNKTYETKTKEIEERWSTLTHIPLSQFTKPFYQNTKWKKQYNDSKYLGVLRIHVKDSLEHLLKMKGWIEGLHMNMPG